MGSLILVVTTMLKPLYDLLSKEKFLWNEEYIKIFTKIKNY